MDLLCVVAEFRHFAIAALFKFSFLFFFFAEVLSQSLVIAIGLYVFAPSSQSDTEEFFCLLDSLPVLSVIDILLTRRLCVAIYGAV